MQMTYYSAIISMLLSMSSRQFAIIFTIAVLIIGTGTAIQINSDSAYEQQMFEKLQRARLSAAAAVLTQFNNDISHYLLDIAQDIGQNEIGDKTFEGPDFVKIANTSAQSATAKRAIHAIWYSDHKTGKNRSLITGKSGHARTDASLKDLSNVCRDAAAELAYASRVAIQNGIFTFGRNEDLNGGPSRLCFTVPVTDNKNQVIGSLSAAISLSSVLETHTHTKTNLNNPIVLVDKAGRQLPLVTDKSFQPLPIPKLDSLIWHLSGSSSHTMVTTINGGMLTLRAFHPSREGWSTTNSDPWTLLTFESRSGLDLWPGLRRHLPFYIFLFCVAVMGSAVTSMTFQRCFQFETEVAFERRFREILEKVDVLAVCMDSRGKVSFCNDALLEIAGKDRKEANKANWLNMFVQPEMRTRDKEIYQQLLDGTISHKRFESKIQSESGETALIAWNACQLKNSLGGIIGIACLGEDITQTRATEERITNLAYAVEQSPNVIMIVNTDKKIEYVNPKFEQLTGYSFDEMRGKSPSILKSGETSDAEYKELWQTISAGGEWRGLFHNRKKDGTLYWERAAISAIRRPDGKITHYLAVKEDVTAQLRLEKEATERNADLVKSKALAKVGRMASMIAHDLRNPLSTVKLGLQMLGQRKSRDWREQEHETRELALEQIQYMEAILSDMLTFSRPAALKPEWLDMGKLLNISVIAAQKNTNESYVKISLKCELKLPTVHGDPAKLRQVFSNLINNALQATEHHPIDNRKVDIFANMILTDKGPGLQVEICDNGVGIDPGELEKLFEPFYTTRAKGTGLGLAIVSDIIKQHGGTVEFLPRERGGTRARVYLPIGPILSALDVATPPKPGTISIQFDETTRQYSS